MTKRTHHKHAGITTVDRKGREVQKSHKISVKHKSKEAAMYHELEVKRNGLYKKRPSRTESSDKNTVKPTHSTTPNLPYTIDNDGFVRIDLSHPQFTYEGIRVKFVRVNGRKKKTVGLEIEA